MAITVRTFTLLGDSVTVAAIQDFIKNLIACHQIQQNKGNPER
jgi:hypothetical protein